MLKAIYLILFVGTLTTAALVVFLNRTVYAALALIAMMLGLTGIFIVIQAPFVALIQLFIYAGAIMVLFLYVIMLVNPRHDEPLLPPLLTRRWLAVTLAVFLGLLLAAWSVYALARAGDSVVFQTVAVADLANVMFSKYLLPFELTSVLLLIAIVGAILIARRS